MSTRKPVLFIDGQQESSDARDLLDSQRIEYLVYDMKKFEESCCMELPSTRAPSIFAPEGLFKGIEGVRQYIAEKALGKEYQSESAYW